MVSGDKFIQSELSHTSTKKHSSHIFSSWKGRGQLPINVQTFYQSVFLLHLMTAAQRQPRSCHITHSDTAQILSSWYLKEHSSLDHTLPSRQLKRLIWWRNTKWFPHHFHT